MRFALVGCGTIAPTHARALLQLKERAELVCCSDIKSAHAAALSEEFGVPTVGFSEVLADQTIDVVIVCTPSGLHAEIGVPALLAGKHVIVEKPMEVSVEACDRLLRAQRTSGTQLGVISQTRFDVAAQLIKRSVDDGELGALILVDCRVLWFRGQDYYDSGGWRGTWDLDGGGCLINQGIHTVDLMRWICGPVRSVYAQARTAAHERVEVEDVVSVTVVFESGALGTVVAATSAYPGFPARLGVFGTKGSAVIEGGRLAALAMIGGEALEGERSNAHALLVATGGTRAAASAVDDGSLGPIDPADLWGEGHRRQLLDFIDAVEGGRAPLVDGIQGRRAVELVSAIYESARTDRVVTLAPCAAPIPTRQG